MNADGDIDIFLARQGKIKKEDDEFLKFWGETCVYVCTNTPFMYTHAFKCTSFEILYPQFSWASSVICIYIYKSLRSLLICLGDCAKGPLFVSTTSTRYHKLDFVCVLCDCLSHLFLFDSFTCRFVQFVSIVCSLYTLSFIVVFSSIVSLGAEIAFLYLFHPFSVSHTCMVTFLPPPFASHPPTSSPICTHFSCFAFCYIWTAVTVSSCNTFI